MSWFDATQVDPAQGSSALPIGNHLAIIKSSAEVGIKSGDGGMLVFTVQIIEGEYKGTEGAYRLNLWHPNPQAKEIAGRQLSALCHVTGRFKLEAQPKGCELFNIPFRLQVAKQKDTEYTEVTGVYDAAGNSPVKGQAPASAAPQAAYQPPPQQPPQAQQPAWSHPPAQQQPQTQPAQPAQQPAWQPPQTGGAPMQQPAQGGQPSWAQQPQAGAQPSWAR